MSKKLTIEVLKELEVIWCKCQKQLGILKQLAKEEVVIKNKLEHYSIYHGVEQVYDEAKTKARESAKELRDECLELLRSGSCPNLTLDVEAMDKAHDEKKGKLSFSIVFIKKWFNEATKNADADALTELTKAVFTQNVIRIEDDDNSYQTHKASPEEMLKGKSTVVLNVYMRSWSYSPGALDGQSKNEISNISKIVNVILNEVSAHTVEDLWFGEHYKSIPYDDDSAWSVSENIISPVSKTRLYKNGKFDLTFKKSEDAEKVARVLGVKAEDSVSLL